MNTSKRKIWTVLLATLLLAACDDIQRGLGGQPIQHGWTFEEAGEFWLRETLDTCEQMSGQELARLNNGHVQVKLPVQTDDAMPLDGVTYRQASTDGFITFHYSTIENDTLNTIGTAEMQLKESMYFTMSDTLRPFVQSRGKGIFTVYFPYKDRLRGEPVRYREYIRWEPAIISVYPGGDSLLICRGNMLGDIYVAEKE